MRFYTSYFANVRKLPKSCIKLSIARKTPDGFDGFKLPDFMPSWDLLKKWRETGDNDYYVNQYKKEVLDNMDIISMINFFDLMLKHKGLSKNTPIVFICYEKPENFCHRHLVAEYFTKNGYECTEYIHE